MTHTLLRTTALATMLLAGAAIAPALAQSGSTGSTGGAATTAPGGGSTGSVAGGSPADGTKPQSGAATKGTTPGQSAAGSTSGATTGSTAGSATGSTQRSTTGATTGTTGQSATGQSATGQSATGKSTTGQSATGGTTGMGQSGTGSSVAMSEEQVRTQLQAQGYSDVQNITRDGNDFRVRASRDGRPMDLRVNAFTGTVNTGAASR
jgi:hypothetical protein